MLLPLETNLVLNQYKGFLKKGQKGFHNVPSDSDGSGERNMKKRS